MKKIELTVPKPCHENWNDMTPDNKGRFCGACQKSVVDFSTLSDRQIAEFFKKPVGSVCGRFHSDQLNREIVIPKKRMPWLRYFFTIALPAFLASCKWGGRQATMGITMPIEQRTMGDTVLVPPPPPPIIGYVLPEITPVDSLPEKKPGKIIQQVKPYTVGELAPPVRIEEVSTIVEPLTECIKEAKPIDTVSNTDFGTMIAGGVVAVRVSGKKQEALSTVEAPQQSVTVTAYPNPICAGAVLTVNVPFNSDVLKRLRLFSSNGVLVNGFQNLSFKGSSFSFAVPPSLPEGAYFVQIHSGEEASQTVKIIVLN